MGRTKDLRSQNLKRGRSAISMALKFHKFVYFYKGKLQSLQDKDLLILIQKRRCDQVEEQDGLL